MKLSRGQIVTAGPAEGWHEAALAQASRAEQHTGTHLVLRFSLASGQTVIWRPLLIPSRGAKEAVRLMAVDHQQLLLDFFAVALGVDEVENLPAALHDATGRPVEIEVRHRRSRGRIWTNVTGFRAVSGVDDDGPLAGLAREGRA